MENLCLVRAKYAFKATNNDELCFDKGDIVTVTQQVEGGWWEGTLNGKTGWFPSNYVAEWKGTPGAAASHRKTPMLSSFIVLIYAYIHVLSRHLHHIMLNCNC